MNLRFSKPDQSAIDALLLKQGDRDLSYAMAGCTQEITAHQNCHSGFTRDHNRIQLGQGQACFQRAKQAIQKWEMFNLGWVQITDTSTPIEPGSLACVRVNLFGLWSLNVCRIVYLLNEPTPTGSRYGFGYGTLPHHAEQGEERFTIEWNSEDGSVWYDILAFSRPANWLTWTFNPAIRRFQKKFALDSKQAMLQDVSS